ncbi:MAG: agmatinase [Ruminococcus sp.]|nr:agmatinase [Ruminococcus sp.]MCM1382056.1 agmatinase [Muribaculaceae bacterium]MCM1478392.1 agmatinase [Muribaculaceae bacterium]
MQIEKKAFIACDSDYESAKTVIFGAAFDSTTSFRPGARFGCGAIRADSFGIETYSPYQDRDLLDCRVFDGGDPELCIGSVETALAQIEDVAAEILADGKRPVMLGGEHSVTLGAVRAVYKKYKDLYIIQFDAHADLRDDYLGVKNSHACVMRRCHELVGDGHIYQFGIRSGEREEFRFAEKHTKMRKFDLNGVENAARELAGKNVYLTIDLDVLDPSVFPGTGTPEHGGVRFDELLNAVLALKGLNIVGADLTELSPHYDQSGVSTAAACKLLREVLLMLED